MKAQSQPLWLEIKKQMEQAIIKGVYKSAGRMLSIAEVAEKYGCGKSTAQKVLETMLNEGTLTKQRGVGYFVKPLVREKLQDQYMNVLQTAINEAICDAYFLGIDKDTLTKIIESNITSVYSPAVF